MIFYTHAASLLAFPTAQARPGAHTYSDTRNEPAALAVNFVATGEVSHG